MSASTSMRMQKQREGELRRLIKEVPAAIRAAWGQTDYTRQLQARNPHLFSSMLGSNADRFYRLVSKTVAKIPEHTPQAAPPLPQHAPYVEPAPAPPDPMAKAWADMQVRIDKARAAIVGTPRQMSLHKAQLNISQGYQRDQVKLNRVEQIAMAPNLNAFGLLIVAHREGKYWVVDGQHRWQAACKRNDMDMLPCLVHDSKSERDEAELYCLINLNRSAVSALDRYRALLTSGDGTATDIAVCLEALDIRVMTHASGPRQLSCIGKVWSMAARDIKQCELVLSVTQELSTMHAISSDLVDAMLYIDRNAIEGLSNSTLLMRLKKLGIHKILDIITQAKNNRTRNDAGQMILGEVNRGLPAAKKIRLRNAVEGITDDDN